MAAAVRGAASMYTALWCVQRQGAQLGDSPVCTGDGYMGVQTDDSCSPDYSITRSVQVISMKGDK